jgi:hypothetical protein
MAASHSPIDEFVEMFSAPWKPEAPEVMRAALQRVDETKLGKFLKSIREQYHAKQGTSPGERVLTALRSAEGHLRALRLKDRTASAVWNAALAA